MIPLTEFGLGNQHGSQPVGGDGEHVAVAGGSGIHEAGLARQHADFGQEAPGAELDDRDDVAETAPGADGDGTGDEHEHTRVDLAGRDNWIAGRVPANRPESPEPVDLLRAEPRKHLIKARVRGGGHHEFLWPFYLRNLPVVLRRPVHNASLGLVPISCRDPGAAPRGPALPRRVGPKERSVLELGKGVPDHPRSLPPPR
jgi:hypothetical protein